MGDGETVASTSGFGVPFSAGVVGSLPRPVSVQDQLPSFPGVESAEAARTPQMDAAVRYARNSWIRPYQ